MNWLKQAKDLKNKQQELLNKAKAENRAFTEDEQKEFDANKKKIENCLKMAKAEKETEELDASFTEPVDTPAQPSNVTVKPGQEPKLFNSFGEQLGAIKNAAKTGQVDERLLKANNAASGMNTGVGADGGFAVESQFMGNLLETAAKDDPILSRVTSFAVRAGNNRVNWNEIDETDISTHVFGGVQVYRVAEAGSVEKSKPKLMERELKLEKLMGLAYATEEMVEDTGDFADQLLTKCFTVAMRRTLAGEIMAGDGVGRCLGILKSGGLITVDKEAGQTADTIKWPNISKMYHRALDRGTGNWAWVVHPDAHEQLDFLEFPVGTGGVPVYLPATMDGTVDTMRRYPVLESDHCSELGKAGDINFVDLADYLLVMKNGVNKAVSMHVEFVTAQMAYRFILRVNGRPMRSQTLKIKNSAKLRGKYITLADRD